MINCDVGANLKLTGSGHDYNYLCAVLKNMLQFDNPDYDKKKRMGMWTGSTPKVLCLWQRAGDALIVPYGLKNFVRKCGVDVPDIPDGETTFASNQVSLYSYQHQAVVTTIQNGGGVVVAPCGAGKTQIGLAIAGRLGMNTLWLTHTQELLKQSMDRCVNVLGLESDKIGTITGGRINAKNGITFATVQTMSKIDLDPLKNMWDVVIVDECHRAVGTPTKLTMFWKVVSSLKAKYKIGLTATPNRNDGMQNSMFSLLGPISCEISAQAVADKTCGLVSEMVMTGWSPDLDEVLQDDGTLNYCALVSACVSDVQRNKKIVSLIRSLDGPVLVLSERVAHLDTLCGMLGEGQILSNARRQERATMIQRMKDGRLKVIFATYQIAKEGLDIPCLNHVVMASPVKDRTTVVQSSGRCMRAYDGKQFGFVHDFIDDMPMLMRWARDRQRMYMSLRRR